MIKILTKDYGIDSKRIYIAGYSNGGMMALRALCQLGKKAFRGVFTYGATMPMKKMPEH